MSRKLVLYFEVRDDAEISNDALYEMAEEIVKYIVPDPPVLIYDGAEVQRT